MKRFIDLLKTEIEKGLPGSQVQWQMASSDRFVKEFPKKVSDDAGVAAVLILLYPHNNSIQTVLMQRHDYKGVHGGQISLPGGKQEPGDKDLIETAIRETKEETGIDPATISIIGTLTPLYIPVSNIIVNPVVGWTKKKPLFNHRPEEVVFLFDADIRKLLDPLIIKIKPFEIRGEKINVKYFDYEGHVIWGATAMILHEFLTLITRSGISI
jgi:8-oxo-dGTP pyrophosphatase MutT (NUDIX family)